MKAKESDDPFTVILEFEPGDFGYMAPEEAAMTRDVEVKPYLRESASWAYGALWLVFGKDPKVDEARRLLAHALSFEERKAGVMWAMRQPFAHEKVGDDSVVPDGDDYVERDRK